MTQYELFSNKDFNELFSQRFDKKGSVSRIGNIYSFLAPLELQLDNRQVKCADNMINFCLQLPDYDIYAVLAIRRLFNTNIANIVANMLKCNIEVENSDIIIKKEHKNSGITQLDGILNLNYIKRINNIYLVYVGLYNNSGESSTPRAFSLNLTLDQTNVFIKQVNNMFYQLVSGLFVESLEIKST